VDVPEWNDEVVFSSGGRNKGPGTSGKDLQ
jgi:hypothetical protein